VAAELSNGDGRIASPDQSAEEDIMPKFVVAPHFRLQEWVAEEKGYFAAEGLEYEFREALDSKSGSGHQLGDKVGAYQTLEAGRSSMLALLATGR
jgi:hypothetical protein